MPNPKPASPWLTRPLNCLPAILFAVFSGTSVLAADLADMDRPGMISGDDLRPIRSSNSPPGQLLAMRLGAAITQQATVPAGPPPGQRAMPARPKPGPCPLPILPALAAMEDTAFSTVLDVPRRQGGSR
jgi:hypothetical protein